MVFAMICHLIMGVSRRDGDFIMGWISLLVTCLYEGMPGALSVPFKIPVTMDTVLGHFAMDGRFTTYAACPRCHATYAPLGDSDAYPSRCTHKADPTRAESICDEALLDGTGRPLRTFLHYSFRDYLAGLLSDRATEQAMDDACEAASHVRDSVRGPFGADFLRQFRGPDGKLFCGRGRFLFSLCVDFFNVEGMNIRGAKTSCGIIALANLNLPLEIRYDPENLYLAGIVPGPKEPSLTDLNHYLRPVVDDLLAAWEDGLFFNRTALFPDGRLILCAIANVVCDLPAARKTAALSPSTSKIFCNVCNCWHTSGDDSIPWRQLRGRTDPDNWALRDVEEMRVLAYRWRSASAEERAKIFEKHGIRWSELWRLPYWDPTRQLVIDSMHCLFEGLASYHFLECLHLSETDVKAATPWHPAFDWPFELPDPEDEDSAPAADPEGDIEMSAHDDALPFARTAAPSGWAVKDVKEIERIHKLLRTPLVDDEMAGDNEVTEDALLGKLTKKKRKCLDFVLADVKAAVQKRPSDQRAHIFNADVAYSLVQWVSRCSSL